MRVHGRGEEPLPTCRGGFEALCDSGLGYCNDACSQGEQLRVWHDLDPRQCPGLNLPQCDNLDQGPKPLYRPNTPGNGPRGCVLDELQGSMKDPGLLPP